MFKIKSILFSFREGKITRRKIKGKGREKERGEGERETGGRKSKRGRNLKCDGISQDEK